MVWTAALLVSARPKGGAGAVFMASACATMLIVATGLVFRKRKRQTETLTQSLYGVRQPLRRARLIIDRVAGMIKKAVDRSESSV